MDALARLQGYANVLISSTASSLKCEKKYPTNLSIDQFKDKLVLVTGCDNKTMKLELLDEKDQHICHMDDGSKTLQAYGVSDGMHIHVTDPSTAVGEFDSSEPTEEFKMSEEDYAKRQDSVLAWKRRNKLGQFREVDQEEQAKLAEEARKRSEEDKAAADLLEVGARCEVRLPTTTMARRGVIRFIGETKFRPDVLWVGIRYDEPVGKNDGSVNGVRYFDDCPDKYGAFVRPIYVQAGDFPELGIDELDEI